MKLNLQGITGEKKGEQGVQGAHKDDPVNDYQQNPKQGMKGGLGLNLAGLKQNNKITDFHDEFLAKFDEYS